VPRNLIYRVLGLLVGLAILQNSFAISAATDNNRFSEVPIEFDGNHILVAVKINGKGPFQMLLDTGADVCLIKMSLAQELSLQIETKELLLGGIGSGFAKARLTKIQKLEIGEIAIKELSLLAIENTPKIKKEPVDGIIGFDFFKKKTNRLCDAEDALLFFCAFQKIE
jgi:hypothetical protein